ncbi:MAG TPA: HNH endonuclease [Sphingobacteriaceae bacterium]
MSKRGSRTAAIYSENSRPKPPKSKPQPKENTLKGKTEKLEKLFEQVWRTYYVDNYIDGWWGKEFKKAFRFFKDLGHKKRKVLKLNAKELNHSLILKDNREKSLLQILKTQYESTLNEIKENDDVSFEEIKEIDSSISYKTSVPVFEEKESEDNSQDDNILSGFSEGAANVVVLTKYERNTLARNACIEYYGYKCSVCGFDFEEFYGHLGSGFIHIHHLIPISNIAEEYEINPINDLRPVCPNCHAMLHKSNPPLTISDLKKLIISR